MKKLQTILKMLVFFLLAIVLTGCLGISPRQSSVLAKTNPDLSGVFVLESQFSNSDVQSYAENNNITNAEKLRNSLAAKIAKNLNWTFPYEVGARPDGSDYLWIQMKVNFTNPDTFCSIFPSADSETQSRGVAAVGQENIYPCALEKYSTSYTDIYSFQDTIFPNGNIGKLSIVLPGYQANTNGAPLGENGITWSWNKDVVAVPMYAITAGLVNFKLEINIELKGNGGDLILKTSLPKDVVLYAKTIYPSSDNPSRALIDRMATGLNLSGYKVDAQEVGSNIDVSIIMTGLSSEKLQSVLNGSGLMTDVKIVSDSSLLKSQYKFSGNLSPWKNGVGNPDSITLSVIMPGQNSPQSWIANNSMQPVLATAESTNWFGILGIGLICLLVVIGAGVILIGGGIFVLRRKKAS